MRFKLLLSNKKFKKFRKVLNFKNNLKLQKSKTRYRNKR